MDNVMEFQFESVDESIIDGCEWAHELRKSLHKVTEAGFLNWCKFVKELGENDVELNKWIEIFKNQIEERFKELVCDVVDMKAKVIENIEGLLEQAHVYSQELGIEGNFNDIDPSENYYKVQKDLMKRTERLERLVQERQSELNKLLEKQESLCSLLEEESISVSRSPLPTKEKLEQLQKYVDDLEQEKFIREEQYLMLKDAIAKMAKELQLFPKTDFERAALSDKEINISKSSMKLLQEYHDDLLLQLKNMKEEIVRLRSTVEDLWKILEESITERNSFHDKNRDISMTTLRALREEVKRCSMLKKANIKVFVEKLRDEVRSLWKNCYHRYEEESSEFPWFSSDFYTEDLLDYHEMEVEKWRTFYLDNEELIKLIAEHQNLWNKLVAMDNEDSGKDRYKNRGGKLLQEEKERNKLSKKIPLIEEKIKSLACSFEEMRGSPFKVFGEPILDYIANLYAKRENERRNKFSARKQKNQDVLTPAKSCMSLFPSTSRMNPTPTPQSAVKRKLLKAETTGKKPRIDPGNPKFKSCGNKLERSRRSIDRKRKILKCRKALHMKRGTENQENHDTTNMTDYNAFEENISSRQDNCRSTLLPIPCINIVPATPNTPAVNNPTTSQKAKTPIKLKLIF